MAPTLLAQLEPDRLGLGLARALPGLAGILALGLHRGVEGVGIDRDAARLQRVLRQVEREAIGVIELEGGVARERVALRKAGRAFVEQAKAALQRLAEAVFFEIAAFR